MKNKKGISAIVATVLIILITVAAVTIIWAAIIPMITENIEGSSECFDASASLSVDSEWSCYNTSGEYAEIQVKKTTGGSFELKNIVIMLEYQGNTEEIELNSTQFKDQASKVYEIALNDSDLEEGQVGNVSFTQIDRAAVKAIVKAGGSTKPCDAGTWTTIPVCS